MRGIAPRVTSEAPSLRKEDLLVAIMGPTAGGKEELALWVAEAIPAEIVCVDSMKIYRGLNIGTAKPKAEVRGRVPHHMLDLVEPDESLTAAKFGEMARGVIFGISSRGKLPLVVAGSGLYLRALLGWIFPGPGANWEVRGRLRREAEERGPFFLHERLKAVDPQAARRIAPRDHRRLIRALEVHKLTGRPVSELQSDHARTPPPFAHPLLLGIRWEKEALYSRIDARAEAMLRGGLVEEVQGLRAQGFPSHGPALQAIGYAQVGAYLDGRMTLEEALESLQRQTRRFAKRQMTWFRGMREVEWFDVPPQGLETLRGRLLGRIDSYLASRGAHHLRPLPTKGTVVLVGFKASGKSTVGHLLAGTLGLPFEDTDSVLEGLHEARTGERLPFREIYRQRGEPYFRELEGEALRHCLGGGPGVVALGGGTPSRHEIKETLRGCTVVYLEASLETLWERMKEEGLPAFLDPEDPKASLAKLYAERVPLYEALADLEVGSEGRGPESISAEILARLKNLWAPPEEV